MDLPNVKGRLLQKMISYHISVFWNWAKKKSSSRNRASVQCPLLLSYFHSQTFLILFQSLPYSKRMTKIAHLVYWA